MCLDLLTFKIILIFYVHYLEKVFCRNVLHVSKGQANSKSSLFSKKATLTI